MVCTVKGTKTHIYWSMKNSGGNADKLKQNVMATSKHYQVYFLQYPPTVCVCVCVCARACMCKSVNAQPKNPSIIMYYTIF